MTLFPPARPPIINYDWIDIDSATGYIEYDCYVTTDSTGTNYSLLKKANTDELFSIATYDVDGTGQNHVPSIISVGTNTSSETFAKVLDIDFDLSEYQLPRIVRGTAHLKLGGQVKTSASKDFSCYFIARIRKWDGSSETEVASIQSATFTEIATDNMELKTSLNISIPQTHFKKGEQLRLTIEGWAQWDEAPAGSTINMIIAGDPQDRADSIVRGGRTYSISAANSRIILIMPYKIEI